MGTRTASVDNDISGPPAAGAVKRPFLLAAGIAAAIFLAVAPTLTWLEFSSGSENLVLETVLEMRRGGPWLVPTLELQPRTQKPPLTTWLTAAGVRPSTVSALGQPDPARRDAAFRRLAWDVRWTALASSCLMLLPAYLLGRTVGGRSLGLLAALVCGTTVLFLRYGRYATTDVQLALWVAVANAVLARAVFEGRWWSGCLAGGLALGLAFMSKGPVALVQSVLPIAVFVACRAWARRGQSGDRAANVPSPRPRTFWPVAAGVGVMLLVGLPWYAYMLRYYPSVSGLWVKEVTRVGATDAEPDAAYTYLILIPLMLPWSAFFVAALVDAVWVVLRRGDDRVVLALALVVVPVVVMTFAPDRKDRYLQPVLVPAAVLTAWALRGVLRAGLPLRGGTWLVALLHWLLVAAVAVGFPLLGAWPNGPLRTLQGSPWYSWPAAAAAAAGMGSVAAAGIILRRYWSNALVAATVLVMLVANAVVVKGYSRTKSGQSDMKPLADAVWAAHPDAETFYFHSGRAPNDLAIYLDRATPKITDPGELKPSDKPRVLFLVQGRGEPPPQAPAGWSLVTRQRREGSWVYAYVLPPAL